MSLRETGEKILLPYPIRQPARGRKFAFAVTARVIREVKFDLYGKRQKYNFCNSVFTPLYSRNKIFVFAVNSKRHFSIFVWII